MAELLENNFPINVKIFEFLSLSSKLPRKPFTFPFGFLNSPMVDCSTAPVNESTLGIYYYAKN